MKLVGIDEAGRGPVIGPMVMAGVLMEESKVSEFGPVKDSKLLSKKQREYLFDIIMENAEKVVYKIISVEQIDDALNSPKLNLNLLESLTSAKIIDELEGEKAIVDCPSTNIPAFTKELESLINVKTKIVAEHKADFKYPIVSAASIIAKVIRDREIEKIKEQIGEDFGSGYPADPKTKAFIEKNWNIYPQIFRKTWKTYQKFLKHQQSLKDF